MKHYDCTQDVRDHIDKIRYWLRDMVINIEIRAQLHDASKLLEPEKSIFDLWTPKLKEFEFGSEEYKQALAEMGEALNHHYKNNEHHPEHYAFGVNGMTLVDLIEMVCDWMAAAQTKNTAVNIDYLADRFDIPDMLKNIIVNTLNDQDIWNENQGVPVTYFTPEHYRGNLRGIV